MTLVELMVTFAILSIVVAAAFSFLAQTQTSMSRTSVRSRNNDEAALAISRLDRLIRSGNILYDPSIESDPDSGIAPGLALRIYTQANSIQKCVQWRISDQRLQERSWSPQWQTNGEWTGWWNVAEGLRNTVATPAFSLHPDPAFGQRLLTVALRVNTGTDPAAEVEHAVSIEGRNTIYGYDESICNVIPNG